VLELDFTGTTQVAVDEPGLDDVLLDLVACRDLARRGGGISALTACRPRVKVRWPARITLLSARPHPGL
jgi:hypothetical protein